jgi:hypothetical protein
MPTGDDRPRVLPRETPRIAPSSPSPRSQLRVPEGVPRSRWRIRPTTVVWLWAAASTAWCLYVGFQVGTHRIAADWWLLLEFGVVPLISAMVAWRYAVANSPFLASEGSKVDPLYWNRDRQASLLAGAAVGSFGGAAFSLATLGASYSPGTAGLYIWVWMQHPAFYWPWLAMGAIIGGLTVYVAQLMRGD